ncbi:hypothetical protein ACQKL5_02190 [Peribacillus sp. NPDC097675]|uniref:hypothetical protein n=1 Tax=Peribacillus sp. NPDC097675 TaxID=3390618 RepID=UPI003D0714A0
MVEYFLLIVVSFILGLFTKNYLPSYAKEKGKNLATKEDIQLITQKTEEVKQIFERDITIFSNELTFRNDYAFKRYSLLYTEIYSIVIQSEYIRFFYMKNGQNFEFEQFPFLEIEASQIKRVTELTGRLISEEVTKIINDVTSANKKALYEFIIINGQYASPRLLKLAVSYRYTYGNYSGTKNVEDSKLRDAFDSAEIALLADLIQTIVIEYNEMRKTVNLSYNESELQTGRLDHSHFQ